MQGVERGERLHRLRQHRQRARIAFAIAKRLLRIGQPLLDVVDLPLGGFHHAMDQRDAILLDDPAPDHHAPLRQGRQRGHAHRPRSTGDPGIHRPDAESGLGHDGARRRARFIHLPRAQRVVGNVGHVMNSRCDAKEMNIVMPRLSRASTTLEQQENVDGRDIRRQRRRLRRRRPAMTAERHRSIAIVENDQTLSNQRHAVKDYFP